MLLEALEQGFPEIEEILGPKQDRRLQKKLIAGEHYSGQPQIWRRSWESFKSISMSTGRTRG
jgi:hypothetical protein